MNADLRPLPATYAAIVFQADKLDPELVTAIMETQPTLSYRRGDYYTVGGKSKIRQFGLWIYSTRNLVHSSSLKKHLSELETIILGTVSQWPDRRLSKIQDLVRTQDVQFRVDVFWCEPSGPYQNTSTLN